MRIVVGTNHRGYPLRMAVCELLHSLGHQVVDLGGHDEQPIDYPDVAAKVAKMVASGEVERGILLSGMGLGMCIAANKVRGIRAVPCYDLLTAEASRRQNDSNVLCLGATLLGRQQIRAIVDTWLKAPFDGGEHVGRLQKISLLERGPENKT